ncbi:MAG: NTPase [Candidatus Micrarchaeota archaeon]
MPQNFFVTGRPKSGKTTLIMRVVEELRKMGLRVGGFITPEEKEHGTRKGFHVKDLESGKAAPLAVAGGGGPKVGKYGVDVKSFEGIALPAMERFGEYDVIVVDEIGRMELESAGFADALDEILKSKTPLVATLHRDFVERYGPFGEVFTLTVENHEMVYNELVGKVKKAFGKRR